MNKNFINKNNLPILFLVLGFLVGLILAVVGGFFGHANWGTLTVAYTCVIVIVWYSVLAIGSLLARRKHEKTKSASDATLSSIQGDDDWD